MRRLLVILAVLAALAAPASALAHPLGNFTVNRHTEIELSGGRLYVHYALDLAEIPTFQLGTRVRAAGFGAEAARGLELRLDGRRAPLRAARAARRRTSRGRRAEDAALRRRLRGRRQRFTARVPRPQLPLADRLARGRRARGRRSRAPVRQRACREPQRRPARISGRPAALAARRRLGDRLLHARRRRRHASAAPRRDRSGAREGRLRVARVARRPLAGRHPALACDRCLLGRGARAHAGARQGDRRRVPRRDEGQADRRCPARRHRDDHAHDRRLRARVRRPCCSLGSSSPRRSIPG